MPIVNQKPETDLMTSDFFYDLPEELIAQTPIEPRDHSRLLHIDRLSGELSHKHFYDVLDMLKEGDTLVVNNSKVIPARLYGHVEGREDAPIELLLLRSRGLDSWETLVKPGKKARPGTKLPWSSPSVSLTHRNRWPWPMPRTSRTVCAADLWPTWSERL